MAGSNAPSSSSTEKRDSFQMSSDENEDARDDTKGTGPIHNDGTEDASNDSNAETRNEQGDFFFDSKSAIRVVVRVRPMSDQDRERGEAEAVDVLDDNQTVAVKSEVTESTTPYTFHLAEGSTCNQEQFFIKCGIMQLVHAALEGFSCTTFAYGQTGSGKTHTLTGPEGDDIPGIIQNSIKYLWEEVRKKDDIKFRFRASYLEIYNEQVYDLLNLTRGPLAVRWKVDEGFHADNLFKVVCETEEAMMDVLDEGLQNRRVAAHGMNDRSSRGHTIMTIEADSFVKDTDCSNLSTEIKNPEMLPHLISRFGRVSFVDLAGSERVSRTKSEGQTLVESHNINKSLLTLGICISSLADPRKRKSHIPYRDSYLTMLLKDSLGGTGMTLMIACVSPTKTSLQETKNTLRYASRAKRIQNRPIVHVDPVQQLIQALKREVRLLRAECIYLREQAEGCGIGVDTTLPSDYSGSQDGIANMARELTQVKVYLQQLMKENEELRAQNSQILAAKMQLEQQQEALEEAITHQHSPQRGSRNDTGRYKSIGYAAAHTKKKNGIPSNGQRMLNRSLLPDSPARRFKSLPPSTRASANSLALPHRDMTSFRSSFSSQRTDSPGTHPYHSHQIHDHAHAKHFQDAQLISRSYPSSMRTKRNRFKTISTHEISNCKQHARLGKPIPLTHSGHNATPELRTGKLSSSVRASRRLLQTEVSGLEDIEAKLAAMQHDLRK